MTRPAYSLLQLERPKQRFLPRAQVEKKKRSNHDKTLKRLANAQKLFTKKAFWIDIAILDRMYYKLINSQRMFPRFRLMSQARQITKRLKILAIDQVIADFYQTFWNAKSMDKCNGEYKFIPTRQFAQYTMHCVTATAVLLDKLQASLMQTFCEYSKSLAKAHFVSMALTMMAICSRLCRIAHVWVTELEQCYKLLYTLGKSLPLATSPDAQHQGDTVDFTCEPDTFQKARQATMKSWSGHESIPGISSDEMDKVMLQHVTHRTTDSNSSMNVDNEELDLGEVVERE